MNRDDWKEKGSWIYIYIYTFVEEATCKNCVEQGWKIKQCFKVSQIGFWGK